MNPRRFRQQTLPDWFPAALPLLMMGLAQSLLVASMVTRVVWGGTTAAVGFWAGLARWRTGKVYAPFLVQALWNLFGR